MSKNSRTKNALDAAVKDQRQNYIGRYNQVAAALRSVTSLNLSPAARQEIAEVSSLFNKVDEDFEGSIEQHKADTRKRVLQMRLLIVARRVVSAAVLIALLVLLFDRPLVSILLFVLLLIARSIMKSVMSKRAESIRASAWAILDVPRGVFGDSVGASGGPSGLQERIDRVYLSSLDQNERHFVLSQRQAERHHMQTVSAQRQQAIDMQHSADRAALDNRHYQDQMLGMQHDLTYKKPQDRYGR